LTSPAGNTSRDVPDDPARYSTGPSIGRSISCVTVFAQPGCGSRNPCEYSLTVSGTCVAVNVQTTASAADWQPGCGPSMRQPADVVEPAPPAGGVVLSSASTRDATATGEGAVVGCALSHPAMDRQSATPKRGSGSFFFTLLLPCIGLAGRARARLDAKAREEKCRTNSAILAVAVIQEAEKSWGGSDHGRH
jgi:hypothetical protein